MLQIATRYAVGNEEVSQEGANETTQTFERQGHQHLQFRRCSLGAFPGSCAAEKGYSCRVFGGRGKGKAGAGRALAVLGLAGSLFAAEPVLQSRIVQVEKQD